MLRGGGSKTKQRKDGSMHFLLHSSLSCQAIMGASGCAAFAFVLALVSQSFLGMGAVTFQNRCSSSIIVSIVDSGNYTIGPNGSSPPINPDSGSSITFWGCKSDQMDCVTSDNPIATVGIIDIGSDSNFYSLSAENGYNLAIRMMPVSSGDCPIISCTTSLGQCPHQLKVTNGNDVVIACKAPSCSDSTELCSSFGSIIAKDTRCRIPGSNYDASSISPSCPSSTDLLGIFSC